jgi:hypothetical protein
MWRNRIGTVPRSWRVRAAGGNLGVAPVGPELGGAGPQHVLVVGGGDGGANQWAHPEDPLQEECTNDIVSQDC